MSEHTREPWAVDGIIVEVNNLQICEMSPVEQDEDGDWIYGSTSESNACRIVACVNACAGMADPAAEIEKLKSDRAELRTCIEETLKLDASLGTAFSWADLRAFKEATRKIARFALKDSGSE